MNFFDIYLKTYGILRNYHYLPVWTLSPLRKLLRFWGSIILPMYLSNKKNRVPSQIHVDEKIIVSFTSFPARINNVWQVVECMLRQTVKPFKIILWVSKEQFPNKSSIPNSLWERENNVFQIRYVEGDIRSHKKYLYAAEEFKESLLFLIDDDLYYPTNIIEKSLKTYRKNPHCVVCNYGSQITFYMNGCHKPYSQWKAINGNDNLFFGSGGGTLFCPLDMYKDISNKDLACSLTPTADDIWLNAMARLAGTFVVCASNRLILPINDSGTNTLSSINNGLSYNDKQIEMVEKFYGRCFDKDYSCMK